jgi:hypothetical protein
MNHPHTGKEWVLNAWPATAVDIANMADTSASVSAQLFSNKALKQNAMSGQTCFFQGRVRDKLAGIITAESSGSVPVIA